jgi:transcriptional regulator with XRE-family HTH domain
MMLATQSGHDLWGFVEAEERLMPTYNEMVGERLRSIRRQRGLSLQDVQKLSDQEFKAAVLGAYERGERSLSLPRLQRLAQFFSVPILQLLPQDEGPTPNAAAEGITIDLNQVERLSGQDGQVVERFLRGIQMLRQDFNGRVLTIRANDLRMLAMLLDQSEEGFSERLSELGVTSEGD